MWYEAGVEKNLREDSPVPLSIREAEKAGKSLAESEASEVFSKL